MKELKIGWQKYEDFLEKQVSSPILDSMMEKMTNAIKSDEDEEDEETENLYTSQYEQEEADEMHSPLMLPLSAKFFDDMSLLSTYDCWLGHTNFNITQNIKSELDKIDGIEVMKVCSRYRFFIGVGQMFDFQDVRKQIEDNIIPK